MDAGSDLLTVEEVSVYLRKSPSTIYRLVRHGHLPGRKVGGTWRFSRRMLEEWIRTSPIILPPETNDSPAPGDNNT